MINHRICLVIGILCISIYPVLVKGTPVSGISSAFYRMFFGFLFLLPYVLIKQKPVFPHRWQWLPVILCGVIFASDIAVWNMSIQYSNATKATLLTNLSPVWVGIGTFLFLPDKPDSRFWIGTLTALSGLVILIGIDTVTSMHFDKGFLLAILSGMLYATYMIISKTVLNRISIVSFMIYSMGISSLYLFVICLLSGSPLGGFSSTVWGIFAFQGLICQLLGWLTISYAVKKMDARRVSLSLLSQSVVTGIIAWIFIHEQISLQMIAGGVIILIGIAITFTKPKPALL
jgi:drug/metabolite transporter (DMT)-like permease